MQPSCLGMHPYASKCLRWASAWQNLYIFWEKQQMNPNKSPHNMLTIGPCSDKLVRTQPRITSPPTVEATKTSNTHNFLCMVVFFFTNALANRLARVPPHWPGSRPGPRPGSRVPGSGLNIYIYIYLLLAIPSWLFALPCLDCYFL